MTYLRRYIFPCVAAIAIAAISQFANVQAEPVQPLRLIVPCAAGSPNDLMARIIAQALSENSGRRVDVENIVPGTGNADADATQMVPADGHAVVFRITGCGDNGEGPRTETSAR